MNGKAGSPQMAREINRALVLGLLRDRGSISRADIARELNLTRATVSNVVDELIRESIVTEVGPGDSGQNGGRRPVMLTLNDSGRFVVGLDLGTTNTVAAVSNLRGEIIAKVRVPTARNHSEVAITEQVCAVLDDAIKRAGIDRSAVLGIGMAVAGTVVKEQGLITFSPNFNWRNVPIAELIQQRTGIYTVADNCTRVMTLGETWYGEGKDVENIFYVNIGYGIGSALVVNGQIYNAHSEFGHITVSHEKVRCGCGKYGCLETVASGSAIERRANELISAEKGGWITAQMLAERAMNGDPSALKIYNEAGMYLGQAISIAANMLSPDKIVIGGGVSGAGEILLNPLLRTFEDYTIDAIKSKTRICISSLGIDAGVYGAIAMVLDDLVFNGMRLVDLA